MRKIRFAIPILLVLAMLMVGIIPASAGQPGTGTTTVYVQNADSTNDAQIKVSYYDYDGTWKGDVNVATLAPYVGYTVNTGDASPALPATWRGSAVVSSDRQVAAVGRTIYSSVPSSGDGTTAGDYLALADPADSSFLSYIFNTGSRNNIFSIQNTESSSTTVTIHYYRKADGTEIPGSGTCSGSPIVDEIAPNGVVYYDLLNQTRNGTYDGGAGGTIPCQDAAGTGQPAAGSAGNFNGSIYIEATSNIAAAAATHWKTFEGTYTGATGDDTLLYYPQAVRVRKGGSKGWVRWSTIVAQNTQTFPISITVSLIGAGGGGSVVFSDTIPALSNVGYNTRYRGSFPANLWTNCTSGGGLEPTCEIEDQLGSGSWTGAATIQVNTPGGRIVGLAHIQYAADHAFTYEALQPGTASQVVVCPFMWDRDATSNRRYSAAIIQNASGSDATVDMYIFKQGNVTGGTAGADLTLDNGGPGFVIGTGERVGINTRYSTDILPASAFDPLGNNWDGSLAIISRDEPILATMSIFRLDSGGKEYWSTDYDCYNVP
jgi:hypothetical protein